jgi:FkbM family methyltransferase
MSDTTTREDLGIALQAELRDRLTFKAADRVDSQQAGLLDVLFCYRLLLGRWPELETVQAIRHRTSGQSVESLTLGFLNSPEFQSRFPQAGGGMDLIVMKEMSDGTRLFFNLKDRQSMRIAAGVHEGPIREAMRRVLRPGMGCVDAGAHIGLYSLLMARIAGAGGGRVYAFEPLARTWQIFVQNIQENRQESVIVATQAACHARNGRGRIFQNDEWDMGDSYVRTDQSGAGEGGAEIRLVRVDDVVPSDVRVGLVKIDIEGSEPPALEGMERILHHDRPVIFTELNPGSLREVSHVEPADYLRLLRAADYRCRTVDDFLAGNTMEYDYHEGEQTTNLVCEPR